MASATTELIKLGQRRIAVLHALGDLDAPVHMDKVWSAVSAVAGRVGQTRHGVAMRVSDLIEGGYVQDVSRRQQFPRLYLITKEGRRVLASRTSRTCRSAVATSTARTGRARTA